MPWRRDLQAERPLRLSTSRPVGEGCSRCAHAPNRVSRRSQSRAVSACRCAARQSRYRLLPRRRVEFGSRRGVLDSRSGTPAPATRVDRIIENRPEPRRDRAPGQHFIVPTAHTAEVNNCVCVIFLCLRLRTVRGALSYRLSGSVHYSTRSVSRPSRTTRRTPGGRPEYSSSVKHSRRS